jgi:flagellar transcriptional activator FlhC
MSYADLHIRALQVARECAALGARVRTISFITGLEGYELSKLFFRAQASTPRGRPPDSSEWYHATNLANQVEGCMFVAHYRRLQQRGFTPAVALLSAYKHYVNVTPAAPRISFDRAFDLASHHDGRWIAKSPSLALVECAECGCEYLSAIGPAAHEDCPFCKLQRRFVHDTRLQESFPQRSVPVQVGR